MENAGQYHTVKMMMMVVEVVASALFGASTMRPK